MEALGNVGSKGTADAPPFLSSGDRVEILMGVDGLERMAAEWDDLADRAAAPAWWRPGWVRAWWHAFGRGKLELLAARRGERLTGVVPMERRGGELRSTTNYHTPSFGLLAADGDALRALAEAMVRAAPRRLTVAFLPEGQPSLAALQEASLGERRLLTIRVLERCPYLPIEGTWPDLLASCRHQFVREIRRRRRRLLARGRLELDVRNGSRDLERLLEEGLAVEAAGWKGERGSAIRSAPSTRDFYTEIARWLAARGALRLSFLRFDGRPMAFDFAIEESGRHSLLKTGYDESYRSDSPGVLLRASALERAFDTGLVRYDFLGKDAPWKREWTSTVEVQVQIQVFRRSPKAAADWAAQRYLRPLARRILKRR